MTSGIPYCDESINCKVGCTHSGMPGCDNCWARQLHDMRHKAYLAGRKMAKQYAKPFSESQLFPERIDAVVRMRKPRTIFWCSTADLFHEEVPDAYIDNVLSVVAATPLHRHLFLTKRIARMADYFAQAESLPLESERDSNIWDLCRAIYGSKANERVWPILNLWIGISCSTQKDLNKMGPILLKIPAAHHWISLEPLLERIDFATVPVEEACYIQSPDEIQKHLDWVVVGCESGSKRRPCGLEWVRSVARQCQAADVPVYVKQIDIGGKVVTKEKDFPPDVRIRQEVKP